MTSVEILYGLSVCVWCLFLFSHLPCEVGTIIKISMEQVKKQRLQEVRQYTQGHTAGKWLGLEPRSTRVQRHPLNPHDTVLPCYIFNLFHKTLTMSLMHKSRSHQCTEKGESNWWAKRQLLYNMRAVHRGLSEAALKAWLEQSGHCSLVSYKRYHSMPASELSIT